MCITGPRDSRGRRRRQRRGRARSRPDSLSRAVEDLRLFSESRSYLRRHKRGWLDGQRRTWAIERTVRSTSRAARRTPSSRAATTSARRRSRAAAAEVPGVRRGCVAAFGISDQASGTERLIVVAETRTRDRADLNRIEAEVIKVVGEEAGTPPDKVELVPPRTIPKTSSGKIRRNQTRKLYEAGELVASVQPPWMQIARLWVENIGGWARLAASETGSKLRQACRASATLKTGIVFGLLARLMPTRQAASRIARSGARLMLAVNRRKFRVSSNGQLDGARPFVMIANRSSSADLLTLVAGLPTSVVLAEDRGIVEPSAGGGVSARAVGHPSSRQSGDDAGRHVRAEGWTSTAQGRISAGAGRKCAGHAGRAQSISNRADPRGLQCVCCSRPCSH